MANLIITRCTVEDAAALARNNMSAFWEDPSWILSWNHTTLEKHIVTSTQRYPRRLVNNRVSTRHQKAIDPETGRLVGYARWILPASHASFDIWPEAVVPAVGEAEEAEIRRIAAAAPWNPKSDTDELDVPVTKMKNELLGKKPYLSMCDCASLISRI